MRVGAYGQQKPHHLSQLFAPSFDAIWRAMDSRFRTWVSLAERIGINEMNRFYHLTPELRFREYVPSQRATDPR
jgi:hypothetical protein